MSIPKFTLDGVLPPHNGDPHDKAATSPYLATTIEICQRFATTKDRRAILKGFLEFRALLQRAQIVDGFQWIDGSFLEDDRINRRSPTELQVVTFCKKSAVVKDPAFKAEFEILANRAKLKTQFRVAHDFVRLDWGESSLIQATGYWCGILSHQRNTKVWKGLLQVPLKTTADDHAAVKHLATLEA